MHESEFAVIAGANTSTIRAGNSPMIGDLCDEEITNQCAAAVSPPAQRQASEGAHDPNQQGFEGVSGLVARKRERPRMHPVLVTSGSNRDAWSRPRLRGDHLPNGVGRWSRFVRCASSRIIELCDPVQCGCFQGPKTNIRWLVASNMAHQYRLGLAFCDKIGRGFEASVVWRLRASRRVLLLLCMQPR